MPCVNLTSCCDVLDGHMMTLFCFVLFFCHLTILDFKRMTFVQQQQKKKNLDPETAVQSKISTSLQMKYNVSFEQNKLEAIILLYHDAAAFLLYCYYCVTYGENSFPRVHFLLLQTLWHTNDDIFLSKYVLLGESTGKNGFMPFP